MPLLHKLGTLDRLERRAAVEALFLVPAVRLALWIVPFRWLRRWVDRTTPSTPEAGVREEDVIAAAVWSVIAVSLRVPKATCLTQALSLKVLLARRGYNSELHLGAVRELRGKFAAHAWLEREGKVLIGGDDESVQAYARFRAAETHTQEVSQ